MYNVYKVLIKRNISCDHSEFGGSFTECRELDILASNENSLVKKVLTEFNDSKSIASIKIKSCKSLLRYLTKNKKSDIYNKKDVDTYIAKFDTK